MKSLGMLALLGLLSGCAALLPSSKEETVNEWKHYKDVMASYERIQPYVTNFEAVCEYGFDPKRTPNVKILNHSQVVDAVLPSTLQNNGGVPKGMVDCIQAQERCYGYYIEPTRIDRARVGNFWLDFLNFRKVTRKTGWQFSALIVIVDDMVVYKQWSGTPHIHQEEVSRNPLGPFQGINVIDMF